MWPWGHLAVAYLLYIVITHRRFGRPPRAVPAIAL
ncbi:metal-dependent hydrolase, partial [Natrinema soli]